MRVQLASLAGSLAVAGSLAAATTAAADPPEPPAPAPAVQIAPAASATPAPALAAPSVVTRALMRELAASQAKLAALVDRDAGLVFIDHFAGAAGGPDRPVEALLCGRAIDRQLRRVRGWLRHAIRDTDEGGLHCANRPGPPTCSFGGTMEYDPVVQLQFHRQPAGTLVLHAITLADEALVDPAEVAAARRSRARLVARLASRTCSP